MAFPEELAPRILFEDTHLMVISKPAGLLSQGEHQGDPNLVDWAREHVGRHYVGLIHRLDRNTSGLMVLGKRTKSAQRLTDALQKGSLTRSYLAWLIGHLPKPSSEAGSIRWTHVLSKDESKNIVRVIKTSDSIKDRGKASSLSVKPVRYARYHGQDLTLAEFVLETGRSHQIRAQSSAEGFPLLGDTKYGAKAQGSLRFPRPALHSHRLSFPHPMTQEPLDFIDALPPDMLRISEA